MSNKLPALRQLLDSADLKRQLPWLGLSSLLTNTLALALPLAILQILDRVVANQSVETLVLLVLGVVIALIIEVVLREISDLTTGWLGARFELQSSVSALQHLVRVPMQVFQKEEPGTHAERVLASAKVSEFYSGKALLALFDVPFLVLFLILIFFIGGWLVLVPMLMSAIFIFWIYKSGNWMQRQIQQRDMVDERSIGFLNEVISNIHSVKTLMLEALMLRRFERLQQATSELSENLASRSAKATNMAVLFRQLMMVSVVFAGSIIVIAGGMTPGGLAACMLLSVRMLQPLNRAMAVWLRYQNFVAANDRLNKLMALPTLPEKACQRIDPVQSSLELRDITLTFDNGKTLFSQLNLSVKAGEIVAICGESGSGKSSLLNLMNGLLQPSSGQVLVDGQTLERFDADSVFKEIAMLPQSGSIVSGTILENLTMFDTGLNKEALLLASRLGLDRSVGSMKMGYETQLGEGVADTIPSGLRQIIIIVRALVRKPSVVLFDEANTSLDMRADQLLREYFAQIKGTCTVILVTPRPSLISLADRTYTLANGVLSEGVVATSNSEGAPQSLAEVPPRPDEVDDIGVVIHRQFSRPSDLSICLKPLLLALQWDGQARDLAEAMPHLAPSLDLSGLCSIMANIGLSPKHFPTRLDQLSPRLMPCLFVPARQSAKLILAITPNGKLRVFDPDAGAETEIDPSALAGDAFVFRSENVMDKRLPEQQSWTGRLAWRMRHHIGMVLALSIVGALLSLSVPLYVRFIYDKVLPSADSLMGAYMVLGVLAVICVDHLFRTLKGKVLAFISGRSDYVLGNALFQRVINLPSNASQGSSVSHQVSRMRKLARLRDLILGPLSLIFFELPAITILLIAIGIINPYVLIILFVSGSAFAALGFWSKKAGVRAAQNFGHLQVQRWEFLNQTLAEMRTIRMSGAAQLWVDRFRNLSGQAIMASFRNTKEQARISGIARVLGSATGLFGLATSAYLTIHGNISGGTMIATMIILWRITGPIENLFMSVASLNEAKDQLAQTDRLMRLKGESDTGVGKTHKVSTQGHLSFSRVSFRYANDADPVLLGVSFAVAPRQLLILTGGVGAGKSSLLKLIERTYYPQAGTIRLDGVDIRQIAINDLRSRLSYMPQQCQIFYGSIAQNILLVNPAASESELIWAVEMAGLSADIKDLPEGLHARISDGKSEELPHGFRQRLSLARVMLKPAAVVLLDEPGAGMDREGEDALLRCIEWLRKRSTIIMVSHRPGHLKLADTILVMRQGSVAASGSFESIKDTIFSEMHR